VRRSSQISAALAVLAALAPSCSGVDAVHGAHTCAIVAGGAVCWGFNYHGQVGDGSPYDRRTPVPAAGLAAGVRALAAGDRFTCAILGDASVACWGRNKRGQLGDGTAERRRTPTQTSPLPGPARGIAAGGMHACAVLEGGAVLCWGANEHAQLADGSHADRATPAPASAPPGAIDVAAGDRHTCALLQGGAVSCWGANRYHEVSAAESEEEPVPTGVPLPGPALAVAAGGYATCAVLASGVSCWGGPMGSSPSAIAGLSNAVAVDVGSAGACALDAQGAVSCWTAPGEARPVPGISGAVGLSVGYWHSCAVLQDGSIRCWGENYAGELGDGTSAASDVPVRVAGIDSGATSVAAGEGWDGHHLGCSGSEERE
jgi:Regulator of chromosome condensation (RCC1) repeat